MATALQILCAAFLVPSALVCLYYLILAAYALISRPRAKKLASGCKTRFAIVIPAHNEEDGIAGAVKACKKLKYPSERFKIYVIADNCTDSTATVAAKSGAYCIERSDKTNRGKGFALEAAFSEVLGKNHDAVVVLDADCRLDPGALRVFDAYLEKGAEVLQSKYVASNPDDSSMSYAVAVGNLIEDDLFYEPKSRLGMAVFLRGTGMVFRKDVLERFPWNAHSIVEDVEYAVNLIRNGVDVTFVNEASCYSDFPSNIEQLSVQRKRWASGNMKLGKTQAAGLIAEGLMKGNFKLSDAGWTFLVLSRPLVMFAALVALVAAAASLAFAPGTLSAALFAASIAVLFLQGIYFTLGIAMLGVTFSRMKLLIMAPVVIGRLIVIALAGFFGPDSNVWARTPRA